MPAALWAEAASWAKRLGVYQAARALGVSYDSLKQRVSDSGTKPKGSAPDRFVELSGAQWLSIPPTSGPVIEWVDSDSTRLIIRLASDNSIDLVGLVEALRRRV